MWILTRMGWEQQQCLPRWTYSSASRASLLSNNLTKFTKRTFPLLPLFLPLFLFSLYFFLSFPLFYLWLILISLQIRILYYTKPILLLLRPRQDGEHLQCHPKLQWHWQIPHCLWFLQDQEHSWFNHWVSFINISLFITYCFILMHFYKKTHLLINCWNI